MLKWALKKKATTIYKTHQSNTHQMETDKNRPAPGGRAIDTARKKTNTACQIDTLSYSNGKPNLPFRTYSPLFAFDVHFYAVISCNSATRVARSSRSHIPRMFFSWHLFLYPQHKTPLNVPNPDSYPIPRKYEYEYISEREPPWLIKIKFMSLSLWWGRS